MIGKNETIIKKNALIASLIENNGNITKSCNAVEITRRTYYNWIEKDDDFKIKVDEVPEVVGDFVEGKLLELIEGLNPAAIIFYCKTKLKHLGYVERTETEQIGSTKIVFQNASKKFDFDSDGKSLEKKPYI